MAAPKRQEVTCPACGHLQLDYVEASSYFCRACGHRFTTQPKVRSGNKRLEKRDKSLLRRKIICFSCQHSMDVPEASDSWQCPSCSVYLDLKNHHICSTVGRSIQTYGTITLAPRGYFSGNQAGATHIYFEGGGASGRVVALENMEIRKTSRVRADLSCVRLEIWQGAVLESNRSVRCQDMVVSGTASFRRVEARGSIHIMPGASLRVQELTALEIKVEAGGNLHATTCRSAPTAALTEDLFRNTIEAPAVMTGEEIGRRPSDGRNQE
ncbi:MAG: hypothetical protein ACFCUX_03840 [Candidatus Methylacidiphilales bacterium]